MEKTINTADSHMSPEDTVNDFCDRNKELYSKKIFEQPLEEIKEDIFFRADNFQNEKWYRDLQTYMAIGICKPDKDCVSDLQKALKILGYATRVKENNGELFLVLQREKQKQPQTSYKQEPER